jgi:hypothetical protein
MLKRVSLVLDVVRKLLASKPPRERLLLNHATVDCIEAMIVMERLSQLQDSGTWTNLTFSPRGAPGSVPPIHTSS